MSKNENVVYARIIKTCWDGGAARVPLRREAMMTKQSKSVRQTATVPQDKADVL
jgi:hypothetical protein